jgi:hypothetical protein
MGTQTLQWALGITLNLLTLLNKTITRCNVWVLSAHIYGRVPAHTVILTSCPYYN